MQVSPLIVNFRIYSNMKKKGQKKLSPEKDENDNTTNSVTPPQLQMKYTMPTLKQGDITIKAGQERKEIEVEYYDVLYTKHMQQKSKTWEDGFMEHHVKTSRLILFARNARAQQIDQKYFRQMPEMEAGSSFPMNKYLVEIESKRKEGKQSVKRDIMVERRNSSAKKSDISTPEKGLIMGKGLSTGSVGKGLPNALNAGGKKTALGFPLKGRKPFVPPQKVVQEEYSDDPSPVINEKLIKNIDYGQTGYPPPQVLTNRSAPPNPQLERAKLKEMHLRKGLGLGCNDTPESKEESQNEAQMLSLLQAKRKDAQNKQVVQMKVKNFYHDSDDMESSSSESEVKVQPRKPLKASLPERVDLLQKLKPLIKDSEPEENEEYKAAIRPDQELLQRTDEGVDSQDEQQEPSKITPDFSYSVFKSKQSVPVVQEKSPQLDPDDFNFEASQPISEPDFQKLSTDSKNPKNLKKRKFDDITTLLEINNETANYEEFQSEEPTSQLKTGFQAKRLVDQLAKNSALDRLKDQQEKRLTDLNQQLTCFENVQIDFSVRHPIYDFERSSVFESRLAYSGYFTLAVIEMLKYAVKEDYDNQKTEIQLIPVQFEYVKPQSGGGGGVMKNAKFKNLDKRMRDAKKNKRQIY